ncbi:MAG: hypothetical protein ACLGSD_14125 [Acidobacteriota bacterium]
MQSWPDRRVLDLLKLEIPILQAPMAGSDSVALARAVSSTGALGSLDYMQLWAGQAAGLAKAMPADEFTRKLAADALSRLYAGWCG